MDRKRFYLLTNSALMLLCIPSLVGCMDGPFFQMKKINPYYRAQWSADRKLGPTFQDRVDEVLYVQKRLPKMPVTEQQEWANKLEVMIREESSPELRRQAVAAISLIDSPVTEKALNTASGDDVEKVRLAACKGWTLRGGAPAKDMLMSLAQADSSNSVRQQAIDGLSKFDDPEVVKSLAVLLDDSSPAIQERAIGSLASITGQEYGGNVDQWRRYIGDLNLPATNPGLENPSLIMPASGTNALPPTFKP